MENLVVDPSDYVRIFFDKFPITPLSTPIHRYHEIAKDMFVDTLDKFMKSAREKTLSNGWASTIVISTYPARIWHRGGNRVIKLRCLYGGVRLAGCSFWNENYLVYTKEPDTSIFMCICSSIYNARSLCPPKQPHCLLSVNQVRSHNDHIRLTINHVEIVFKLIVQKHPPSEYDNIHKIR